MLFDNPNFTVQWDDQLLNVAEHYVGGQQVFRVVFADGRPPIVVAKANAMGSLMWMSIPQGRLQEAEIVGKLIQKHFDNK